MKTIILAGGSGTRLWPLSRERYPKQFIRLQEEGPSLFRQTYERCLLLAEPEDIYIVTNSKYRFAVKDAVEETGYPCREENIILEPEAKNTLPAVFAGVERAAAGGDDTVVVFPSDHVIGDGGVFAEIIRASEKLAREHLVTFGIRPERPETGYGYIVPGEPAGNGFLVKEFREKPSREKASEYIAAGCFWNSGIFMFSTEVFREEVRKHAPETYDIFSTGSSLEEKFAALGAGMSFDYGIMEKSFRAAVVPADIGWSDLGSFDTFYNLAAKDGKGNAADGEHIFIEASGNLIRSEKGKTVAAVGVDDLIIVDSADALLVCRKEQSPKIREVVGALKKDGDLRAEYHLTDYRPWGHYRVLEKEKGSYKIKKVSLKAGRSLSLQLHHRRSESWTVVQGTAEVTIDGETMIIGPGENVFVRAGQKHRLKNPGDSVLEIIEVQLGSYLEEDDIIRFEDDYGRK